MPGNRTRVSRVELQSKLETCHESLQVVDKYMNHKGGNTIDV